MIFYIELKSRLDAVKLLGKELIPVVILIIQLEIVNSDYVYLTAK
jgi:hypothetical protein